MSSTNPPDVQYRSIVEAMPNAIVMVDRERSIRLANRKTEEMFGYMHAELVGSAVELLIPDRYRHAHKDYVGAFFRKPETRPMGAGRELFGRRKDGSEVPIEIGLSPIETAEGICTLACIIDITERKRAQEKLELMVEASPSAMIMIDSGRQIRLVNRRAEELFHYARSELLGLSIEMLVPKQYRERHPEHVRSFAAHPEARPMGAGRELFALRKDGVEVPVEIGLTPIDTIDGTYVVASIIDITERKRSEDELRRSNAELEQFAYVASHDLQEPLRMVANYTELLERRYGESLDDKAIKYIRYASDGARRMQRLVSDLLAYSRVGSQGKPLVPVETDRAFNGVLLSLQRLIRESNASVNHAPLPRVMADEGQLHQLFQNLVSNAIKFKSDAPPKVQIDAHRDGPRWVFKVADNGIGLDMQYAQRIFQMFQRLHEMGKYEGSGIGLAIAKRIVERHGGSIWVESEPGEGCKVFFTLLAVAETEPA